VGTEHEFCGADHIHAHELVQMAFLEVDVSHVGDGFTADVGRVHI
jgi:hypothetical protein